MINEQKIFKTNSADINTKNVLLKELEAALVLPEDNKEDIFSKLETLKKLSYKDIGIKSGKGVSRIAMENLRLKEKL